MATSPTKESSLSAASQVTSRDANSKDSTSQDTTPQDTTPASQDAIFVAVMGQTGTGKSSFINKATGSSLGVGDDLNSCTRSCS